MHPTHKLKFRKANRYLEPKATASSGVVKPETEAMPVFNIRLVERTMNEGSADFLVDAPSADAAADIVATAHAISQASGVAIVTLPDGQSQVVEAETVVAQQRSLILLDKDGMELREILIPSDAGRAQ